VVLHFRKIDLELKSYVHGCISSIDPLVTLEPLTTRLETRCWILDCETKNCDNIWHRISGFKTYL